MLKGHDLFKSFLPEQVEALSRFCSTKTLEKGHTVYDADRKATHVFVLLDGQVQLRFPGSLGEAGPLVGRIGKGELFGIAPLLGSDRYTTRAQCATSAKVLYVEARPLIQLLKANPVIGHHVMTAVARAYFDRYELLMQRVQKVLADLA